MWKPVHLQALNSVGLQTQSMAAPQSVHLNEGRNTREQERKKERERRASNVKIVACHHK